jgi:hypothetical protein
MKCCYSLVGLLLLGISINGSHGDTAFKPETFFDDQPKSRTTKIADVRASVGPAGLSAKPAWEWSDEERVRVRFDPTSVRERAAAHAAGITQPSVHSQAQPSEQSRPSQQYFIDGSRNPELFLPDELLDSLLVGLHSNAAFRTNARHALAGGIREMGYAEDEFWARLQRLSAPYLALKSHPGNGNLLRLKTPDGKLASFPIDVDRCVARHNLLQAARTTFGAEKFQRFLYTEVAPEVQRGEAAQIDPSQELLFVARGCHQ